MSREKKSGSRSRLPDGDDGRTIADMNVDGMPWYSPAPKRDLPPERNQELMPPRDRRRYILGALLAAIVLAAIFGAAYFLFLLFCTRVWFR